MRAIKIIAGTILTGTPIALLAYAAGGWPAIAGVIILLVGAGSFFGGLILIDQ